ncbi:hypothetical protein DPSP01_004839 [Paraphaeosphaeria sporulosa]|uniref:Uncharacterized protein n=1 Tax=Paraphaeosphaeria sporulosa TaxID=1460663 RepID=A0A177CQK1_9PLEO|nr:uncharacterized protein CC84DRAFT_601341 [Paraphaeosphaeria sporulosa]OAG09049.1 hypothetical protein CC84DRAFT_601341 [Paraphaeosphaeria sporulosa]
MRHVRALQRDNKFASIPRSSGRYLLSPFHTSRRMFTAGQDMRGTRVWCLARNSTLPFIDRHRSAFLGAISPHKRARNRKLWSFQYFHLLHASLARLFDPVNTHHMETVRMRPPRHLWFDLQQKLQRLWLNPRSVAPAFAYPCVDPYTLNSLLHTTPNIRPALNIDKTQLAIASSGRHSSRGQSLK